MDRFMQLSLVTDDAELEAKILTWLEDQL